MSRFGAVLIGLALLALVVLPVAAEDGTGVLGGWQGAASAAAEAASSKGADPAQSTITETSAIPKPDAAPASAATPADAIVAPQPVPAVRPDAAALPSQPDKSAAEPQSKTAKATDDAPSKGAHDGAASKDGKASKDAKSSKDAKPAKEDKKPALPAKQLFAAAKTPAPLAARAIGWYAKGCLAGGKSIAVDGPAWQVMRLSRNRYWGHPQLIELVERLGKEAKDSGEWPGLLVGDISQARGGPMLTGHASHQVGLDADIWFTPMPDRRLSEKEREDLSATSMLASDDVSVNPKVWGDGQVKLLKRAASYSKVERILVHPAIKKALCEASGTDKAWLSKVRPYFGHYYHFHVRIGCPAGTAGCTPQPPVPGDDGCGDELKGWLKRVAPKPPVVAKPVEKPKPGEPPKKKPEITLADLPAECKAVITAGGNVPPTEAVMVDTSKDAGPAKGEAKADVAPAASTSVAAGK